MTIAVGKKAPDLTFTTDRGPLSLSSLHGQNVIVYFYPKDDTPGCTVEACAFQDNLPQFDKLKTAIVGVSPDNAASHAKFRAKFGLKFHLATDTDTTVAKTFGTWVEKSMYGKKYMGVERSTFLIGPDGVVKAVWRKVDPKSHVQEVMTALAGKTVPAAAPKSKAAANTKAPAKKNPAAKTKAAVKKAGKKPTKASLAKKKTPAKKPAKAKKVVKAAKAKKAAKRP